MSKKNFLKKLSFKKPSKLELLSCEHVIYKDPLKIFIQSAKDAASEIFLEKNIEKIINSNFPDIKNIASIYKEFNFTTINPNTIKESKKLNNIDIAIVKGTFGVAENGAILINEPNNKHRALYFICKHLIIILNKNNIVNNMQEAYDKIEASSLKYATFISGPSKTADIEQALVIGAHGAKKTTIVLTQNMQ